MRYAVFLTFDEKTQKELQALRESIASNVPGAPKVEGKMGPHLTLAVFDDSDQKTIMEKFKTVTENFGRFALKLNSIGYFMGVWKAIYAAPIVVPELLKIQRLIHSTFSISSMMVPHYVDPENWVPHVTLAKGLKGQVFREAKEYAERNWKPLDALAVRTGLINVQRPLEVLASRLF